MNNFRYPKLAEGSELDGFI